MITNGFELEMAQLLADMCGDAYEGNEAMSDWLGWYGIQQVLGFHQEGISGYVLDAEDTIFVVFNGTDEFSDWLVNLNVPLTESWDCKMLEEPGQVHQGWQSALDKIRPQLQELLELLYRAGSEKPVIFTGHSLGGALASLAALSLVHHADLDPFAVYTFGSPRVGDKDFAKTYNTHVNRAFRLEVCGDVVPYVPPMFSGYRHCGQLVYIAANGKLKSRPSWWYRLWSSFRAWKGVSIGAHAIEVYAEKLNA